MLALADAGASAQNGLGRCLHPRDSARFVVPTPRCTARLQRECCLLVGPLTSTPLHHGKKHSQLALRASDPRGAPWSHGAFLTGPWRRPAAHDSELLDVSGKK